MARTARQRAALRKAQLASARKRRGKGKGKLAKANRSIRRGRRVSYGAAIVGGALVGLGGYRRGVRHGVKNERRRNNNARVAYSKMSSRERREYQAHVDWNGP